MKKKTKTFLHFYYLKVSTRALSLKADLFALSSSPATSLFCEKIDRKTHQAAPGEAGHAHNVHPPTPTPSTLFSSPACTRIATVKTPARISIEPSAPSPTLLATSPSPSSTRNPSPNPTPNPLAPFDPSPATADANGLAAPNNSNHLEESSALTTTMAPAHKQPG
jgi:hypothetical protein